LIIQQGLTFYWTTCTLCAIAIIWCVQCNNFCSSGYWCGYSAGC